MKVVGSHGGLKPLKIERLSVPMVEKVDGIRSPPPRVLVYHTPEELFATFLGDGDRIPSTFTTMYPTKMAIPVSPKNLSDASKSAAFFLLVGVFSLASRDSSDWNNMIRINLSEPFARIYGTDSPGLPPPLK